MLPHPKSKWQRSDEDWRWFPLSFVGERVGVRGNAAHEYSIAHTSGNLGEPKKLEWSAERDSAIGQTASLRYKMTSASLRRLLQDRKSLPFVYRFDRNFGARN